MRISLAQPHYIYLRLSFSCYFNLWRVCLLQNGFFGLGRRYFFPAALGKFSSALRLIIVLLADTQCCSCIMAVSLRVNKIPSYLQPALEIPSLCFLISQTWAPRLSSFSCYVKWFPLITRNFSDYDTLLFHRLFGSTYIPLVKRVRCPENISVER